MVFLRNICINTLHKGDNDDDNNNNIPGKHEVKELQKTAILDTAHILRKGLTYKYNSANAGTNYIDTINNNDRIAETLYSLGTWFVSGIYV